MVNPAKMHWVSLRKLILSVKLMDLKGIVRLGPELFRACGLADTYFGNHMDTKRRISHILITIGGCLVDWHMTKHSAPSNSNTEERRK